jgi:hypothetical protein
LSLPFLACHKSRESSLRKAARTPLTGKTKPVSI